MYDATRDVAPGDMRPTDTLGLRRTLYRDAPPCRGNCTSVVSFVTAQNIEGFLDNYPECIFSFNLNSIYLSTLSLFNFVS